MSAHNLERRGRRQRARLGTGALVAALILAVALVGTGQPRMARGLVFPLLLGAFLGWFQARAGT